MLNTTHGTLIPISQPYYDPTRRKKWKSPVIDVECKKCGSEFTISTATLYSHSLQCRNCVKIKNTQKIKVGDVFGKRTVIEIVTESYGGDSQTMVITRCECGTIKKVKAYVLLRGGSTQCRSCSMRDNRAANPSLNRIYKKKYSPEERTLRTAYNFYKVNATNKGRSNELTYEVFVSLAKQNCYYCGCPPSNGIDTKWNGLDRIDPNKGYELDNIVPCCRTCNMAKKTSTQAEFITWAKRLAENLISKGL